MMSPFEISLLIQYLKQKIVFVFKRLLGLQFNILLLIEMYNFFEIDRLVMNAL